MHTRPVSPIIFYSTIIILLLCSSIAFSPVALAQVTLIEFDFKKKEFGKVDELEDLQKGGFYQVKINNINSSLYKVVINNKDSVVSKALPVPSFSLLDIGNVAALISALPPVGNVRGSSPAVHTKNVKASATKILKENQPFAGTIKAAVPARRISDPDAAKLLIEAQQEVLRLQLAQLKNLRTEMDNLLNAYNSLLLAAEVEFKLDRVTGLGDLSALSIRQLYGEFNRLRTQLVELDQDVRLKQENYLQNIKAYASTIAGDNALKSANEKVMTALAAFDTLLTRQVDIVSPEKTLTYMTSIVAVLNGSSYEYLSMPLQFSKEQTALILSIVPRKMESLLHSYRTQLLFPLQNKTFWGISSGFFISSLYNEAYSTRQIISTADTTYNLVSEDPAKVEFGINAMVRYGRLLTGTKSTYWQVGFGPGAAISDKIQPRLLAGTGLAFGTKHRLVLDIGGILGFRDRLSNVYNLSVPEGQRPERTTVSRLKAGGYLSVGYVFN